MFIKSCLWLKAHKPGHLEIKIKITFVRVFLLALLGWNFYPHHSTTIAAPSAPKVSSVGLVRKLPEPKLSSLSHLAKKAVSVPTPTQNAYPTASYHGTGDYYLDWIVQHESGGNPYAMNPSGACGLFQALPCSKMGCSLSDIACQINWGRQYVVSTYGSSYGAYQHWLAFSWY